MAKLIFVNEKLWGLPDLPRVFSSWSLLAHRSQNRWSVRGEVLFSSSKGQRGVRKHVCVTHSCTGSVPGAILGPPEPRGGCLCSGAAPGWVCLSVLQPEPGWCLTRLLLCSWPNLNVPRLSHLLTVRWHLAAPCCVKMLACHLALLEPEEQVLSLRDVIYLIYLAPALLLLIFFFTLGTCNEFSELKSDFQGWLFTASRGEKNSLRVSCLLLENTFRHP